MADRNVSEVIDKMVIAILADIVAGSPDAPKLAQMCLDLNRVAQSAGYTAPEMMRTRWAQTLLILQDAFPNPAESPLGQTLANIFADKA